MTRAATGINLWVNQLVTPLFAGKSPELFMAAMIMFMCEVNMAFVLPCGSTGAAILAVNREWVKPKELFTHTGIGVIIVYVLGAIMLAISTLICK